MLDGKDELLALDSTAFKVNGKWTAEFVISIFSKRDDEVAHKLEEEILALFGASKDAVEWSRLKYFIAIPRQNVLVNLKMVDGNESFTVGPTDYNGIMSPEFAFPIDRQTWAQGETTKFEVVPQNGFDQRPNFTTFFAEDGGVGVISGKCFKKVLLTTDLDDTIKISDVNDRIKLLRHTFLDKHGEPVPGMPELYKTLSDKLDNPTFVYLSASPWQLYPFLHEMITANYPRGQIILRDMSYVELSSFITSLTIGTQEFKQDEMDKLHRWLPNKQFLAIGDSTQTDPEAYGTMYHATCMSAYC